MSKQTENLQLYKTDMETDGNDFFNFDTDLNQNWDKIDSVIGKLSELTTDDKTNLVKAIVEIISKLDKKSSVDLNNLSSIGQALLDAKIEAEALCEQNGYIKFKLNKISKEIIIQWGFINDISANQWVNIVPPLLHNMRVLIASGNESDIRVVRNNAEGYIKFYCPDKNTNIEWLLIGF